MSDSEDSEEEEEEEHETEIEFESDLSRDEIADRLETFADDLRGDDPLDIDVGGTAVTINPPETVEFEVEIEDEGETIGEDVERSVEVELEWMTQDDEEALPEEEE